MLRCVCLGTADIAQARRFADPVLALLGPRRVAG
jgi:hypothetical protein